MLHTQALDNAAKSEDVGHRKKSLLSQPRTNARGSTLGASPYTGAAIAGLDEALHKKKSLTSLRPSTAPSEVRDEVRPKKKSLRGSPVVLDEIRQKSSTSQSPPGEVRKKKSLTSPPPAALDEVRQKKSLSPSPQSTISEARRKNSLEGQSPPRALDEGRQKKSLSPSPQSTISEVRQKTSLTNLPPPAALDEARQKKSLKSQSPPRALDEGRQKTSLKIPSPSADPGEACNKKSSTSPRPSTTSISWAPSRRIISGRSYVEIMDDDDFDAGIQVLEQTVLSDSCRSESESEDDISGLSEQARRKGEEKVRCEVEEKASDYSGENEFPRDEHENATITADVPLSSKSRKAVGGGGGVKQLDVKEPTPKSEMERELIQSALKSNDNLQTMFSLDNQRITEITDIAWKETCKGGTAIITEGDLQADYFYVVQEGSFDVFVAEDKSAARQPENKSKHVAEIGKGGSFGELALLYLVARAATVVAKVDSVVWVFDRQSFKDILMKVSNTKIDEYCRYVNKVAILTPLLADEKTELAKALVEMNFAQGDVIMQQGEPGNKLYILREGDVVWDDTVSQEKLSASKSRDETQIFGEHALRWNEPLSATVTVCSETAAALVLDRESFTMLVGSLEDISKRAEEGESRLDVAEGSDPVANSDDKAREHILRKDLSKVGLLGCGAFGAVELWEHKVTNETYAMKGLSKGYIVKTRQQVNVMNEKNMQMKTNSLFIIRLWETYNSSQTLYFLMEAALGGELYATYNKKAFWGKEGHAKFYVAGTVFAFDHMHQLRIIYRDLKPENLLLNYVGHTKLTDMGLAKVVIGKTYTTCGTPDYFAPEVIASTGHTHAVDWWTLGVLLFELMSGHPPFEAATPVQIYAKVQQGIKESSFSCKCQGPVADLVKALLKNEPNERICCRPGGVQNLKDHEWYQSFDWSMLENLSMEPPYIPAVKSNKDIANFSVSWFDRPPQIEYADDGSGWDKDFASVEDTEPEPSTTTRMSME